MPCWFLILNVWYLGPHIRCSAPFLGLHLQSVLLRWEPRLLGSAAALAGAWDRGPTYGTGWSSQQGARVNWPISPETQYHSWEGWRWNQQLVRSVRSTDGTLDQENWCIWTHPKNVELVVELWMEPPDSVWVIKTMVHTWAADGCSRLWQAPSKSIRYKSYMSLGGFGIFGWSMIPTTW